MGRKTLSLRYYHKTLRRWCFTLPKWKANANVWLWLVINLRLVRKIVHAEWGIENNGFWDLKNNWFMTHNYHHHPVATFAALLILFLAYNLFYAYVYLRMKTYRLYQGSDTGVQN